jgi:hypothetical protein
MVSNQIINSVPIWIIGFVVLLVLFAVTVIRMAEIGRAYLQQSVILYQRPPRPCVILQQEMAAVVVAKL